MKKLLLVLLLALLPLQFSWAAAAVYCQHEKEVNTQHFGHHTHQHDATADLPDDAEKVVKAHDDCGYCHLACQASFAAASPDITLPVVSMHVEHPAFMHASHIPEGLHRPDWRFVA